MNNLKTAVMVVLLLGALYGAYQFLNERDVPPPPEVLAQQQQGIAPPTIEFGSLGGGEGPMLIDSPASSSPVAITTPAEMTPPGDSPASTLSPPSFTVIPSEDEAPLPAETETATNVAVSNPLVSNVGAVPPVENTPRVSFGAATTVPSAYAERPARAESTEEATTTARASNNSNIDPFTGLQSNPFYRPGKAVDNGAVAQSKQVARQTFERAWNEARELVEAGKFPQALAVLTVFYDSADLTAAERKQLLRTLDSLAGRVIYSTEHSLEEPYVVRTDETLMDVAQKYNVPYQLLQNINGIRDPLVLLPRSKLKVVRGPFHADICLSTGELALFVDKYYAGRFPFSVGQDPVPSPGDYSVKLKRDGKDYYLTNGKTIPERHPSNPYGQYWIDLGKEVCIHGSAERDVSPQLGCISLAPVDAADVYGILSVGSTVTIRR